MIGPLRPSGRATPVNVTAAGPRRRVTAVVEGAAAIVVAVVAVVAAVAIEVAEVGAGAVAGGRR